jgi:hypothetical protein
MMVFLTFAWVVASRLVNWYTTRHRMAAGTGLWASLRAAWRAQKQGVRTRREPGSGGGWERATGGAAGGSGGQDAHRAPRGKWLVVCLMRGDHPLHLRLQVLDVLVPAFTVLVACAKARHRTGCCDGTLAARG